jgi:PAS domain S-box-containing protein
MINFRSYRFRIASIFFLFITVIVAIFAFSIIATTQNEHEKRLLLREQDSLKFIAEISRSALLTNEFDENQIVIDRLTKKDNIDHIYVADSRNKIVASSSYTDLGEELQQSKLRREGWQLLVVSNEASALGTVAVQFNHSELETSSKKLLKNTILLFPVGILVSTVVALCLGKLLSKRIETLENAVSEVTRGNLQVHIDDQGRDEISAVATAFNLMTSSLRQTVESLKTSEDSHRNIIQMAMDGFWRIDTDGYLQEVNAAYCRMSGYSMQELLAMHISDLDANETPQDTVAHLRKIMELGEDFFESRHRRKNGSFFHVEISVQHHQNDTNSMVAFLRDISERKRSEETLRKSEERFRIAQELSPDGFTIFRPVRDSLGRVEDFTWVYENAMIARLNGTEPKAVVGRRLLELFPEHRGSKFMIAYQQVAESGEHCIFEADYKSEGSSEPSWLRIVVVPAGEDIAILAQDITERKQTEETLAAISKLLQDVTDNSPALIYVVDTAGRFLLINRSFAAVFGVPSATLIGKTRNSFIPPEIAAQHLANDQQVIAGRQPITFEEENEEQDGKHTYLSIKFPLFDLQGDVSGICGISTDISVAKRAEKRIYEQLQELQRWQNVMLDREDRVIELKKEINDLLACNGQPLRYATDKLETGRILGAGPVPAEPGGGGV